MSIKAKFMLLNVFIVLFSLSAVVTISFYVFHVELKRMAQVSQETRIKTFWELLHQKGSDIHITNGQLMIGNYVVNNDFELPDKLKSIAGGTATIFMGDTRISTNVMKSDGTRAIGTKLQGDARKIVFEEGKPYRGEALILDIPISVRFKNCSS